MKKMKVFLHCQKQKRYLTRKWIYFTIYLQDYIIIMVNLLVMMRGLLICKYPLSFWTEALFPVRRDEDEL